MMSTYTVQPHERHHRVSEWTLQHPLISTLAAVVAAVVAGALIGVLFTIVVAGAPVAQQHRAGGDHARAAAVHRAAIAATSGAHTVIGATTAAATRSPARSGFAVGKTAGADDGYISLEAGVRAPVRGGFPGRSLGAGHVPGGALARTTASR
jgi:hypothetical protein